MNPYIKIAIKVGVVVVICLILLVAYNLVGHKAFMAGVRKTNKDLTTQKNVAKQLDSLLQYKDILPQIRFCELRDMETIRNLVPPQEEFILTTYLRQIHGMLLENHLDTDGILIGKAKKAPGGTSFQETFGSDVTALQKELDKIVVALQSFKDGESDMGNLLSTYQFYKAMSTGSENFAAIAGGIEGHNFQLRVKGSYVDIKKFTFDVFNMRPHTAMVDFQMAPAGVGSGPTRLYQASFTLVTYGDANKPPPLWDAYHKRGEKVATAPPAAIGVPGAPGEPPVPVPPTGEQPAPPPATGTPGAVTGEPGELPSGGMEATIGGTTATGGAGH